MLGTSQNVKCFLQCEHGVPICIAWVECSYKQVVCKIIQGQVFVDSLYITGF